MKSLYDQDLFTESPPKNDPISLYDQDLFTEEDKQELVGKGEFPKFKPTVTSLTEIRGFEGEERGEELWENVKKDFNQSMEGWASLKDVLLDDPSQVIEIAKKLPEAMVDSYMRWADAAQNGQFWEATQKYPLQAVQDLTLPLSILVSGGGSLGLKAGAITAKTAIKIKKASDIISITGAIADPVIGVPGLVAKKFAVDPLLDKLTKKSITDIPNVDGTVKQPTGETTTFSAENLKKVEEAAKPKAFTPPGRKEKIPKFDKSKAQEFLEAGETGIIDRIKLVPDSDGIIRSGNINQDRIDTPESFKKAVDYIVDQHDEFDKIRGEKRTFSKVDDLAKDLNMDKAQLQKTFAEMKFSDAKIHAAKTLNEQKKNDMLIAMGQAKRTRAPVDLVNFQSSYMEFVATQELISGITAEAGRALNVFKKIPKDERLRNENLVEILRMSGGEDHLFNTIDKLEKVMQANPEGIAKASRDMAKATTWDKFLEGWTAGLLSGPQTHVVNLSSNMLVNLYTQAENVLATGISQILRPGNKDLTAKMAVARIVGQQKGFGIALKYGLKTFMTEESPDLLRKNEFSHKKAIGGKVGGAIRTPFRLPEGSYVFFKMLARNGELHAIGVREALKKGIPANKMESWIDDFVKAPNEIFEAEAIANARKMTFTNELKNTDWISSLGKLAQKATSTLPALKFVIPFVRTPTNIAKFAIERTPLAFTLKDTREALFDGFKLRKGVQAEQAWARIMMGSAIGTTTMLY